jgi:hypothetical protein
MRKKYFRSGSVKYHVWTGKPPTHNRPAAHHYWDPKTSKPAPHSPKL